LGSIPFGLIITSIFLKKDIRKIGSGNIGATNVLRAGNKLYAVFTLLFDILKGYLTIIITLNYFPSNIYLAGLICFLGHIFPVWLKFKGGKGVAAFLGIVLAISLKFALLFGLIWILILFIFRYSSLSSITSTLVIFLYSLTLDNNSFSIYLFIMFVILLYTHKDNIFRLRVGKENKIKF
jgi:glycerol-3-phosphate acyltransferase PlsY|tara:strand:- start:129 stop:668 length:540 start_codon:yes stop_codon:yes gene_type:complete